MSNAAYTLSARRLEDLDSVDRMSPGLRACVHEFGLPIVRIMTKFGIRDPRHIREIVRECWLGGRQAGQKSGAFNTLDVILARGPVSSMQLRRILEENNMAIVRAEPTRAMIEASMAEVSGHNVLCTREEKHRRRLRAAIRAEMISAEEV